MMGGRSHPNVSNPLRTEKQNLGSLVAHFNNYRIKELGNTLEVLSSLALCFSHQFNAYLYSPEKSENQEELKNVLQSIRRPAGKLQCTVPEFYPATLSACKTAVLRSFTELIPDLVR